MRIIHVVRSGPEDSIRGDERHILYLAAAQQAQGLDVAVMIDGEDLFTGVCEREGIPVITTQPFGLPGKVNSIEGSVLQEMEAEFTSFRAELIEGYSRFRADLIHCHNDVAAYTAIAAGNKIGIPCALTFHVPVSSLFPHLRADRKFAVLSISNRVVRHLRNIGIPEEDLYYVPSGTAVGPRLDQEVVSEPGLLIVGRVNEEKGIHTAILAISELRRMRGGRCPEVNIYGACTRIEYFREMVAVLGLEDIIRFRGSQFDILRHCSSSNILVMPSRSETGPLVVLEAMSRGMPVVSTDVGDAAEILPDRRYGRIVPPDSIVMLAEAIDSALADFTGGRFDPSLPIERHQALYTAEKMAERIESVYKQILAS